jgi:hypothetical protein
MVDRTRLEGALDRFLAREPEIAFDLHDELRVIVAAARAVVEASEILWCEEHAHPAPPEVEDALAYSMNRIKPCRMVRWFLVPAEEES